MKTFSLAATVTEYASLAEAPADEQRLVAEAQLARAEAYAPYSNFLVGAALLLSDGSIIRGANQENASYGMTACAERTALWRAWLQGRAHDILGIAISGGHRDEAREPPPSLRRPIRPCGACRQVLSEARFRAQRPIFVVLDSRGGALYRLDDVEALLPLSFDPRDLGVEPLTRVAVALRGRAGAARPRALRGCAGPRGYYERGLRALALCGRGAGGAP